MIVRIKLTGPYAIPSSMDVSSNHLPLYCTQLDAVSVQFSLEPLTFPLKDSDSLIAGSHLSSYVGFVITTKSAIFVEIRWLCHSSY